MDFPIKNGGSFNSYVSHYQRVLFFPVLFMYFFQATRVRVNYPILSCLANFKSSASDIFFLSGATFDTFSLSHSPFIYSHLEQAVFKSATAIGDLHRSPRYTSPPTWRDGASEGPHPMAIRLRTTGSFCQPSGPMSAKDAAQRRSAPPKEDIRHVNFVKQSDSRNTWIHPMES